MSLLALFVALYLRTRANLWVSPDYDAWFKRWQTLVPFGKDTAAQVTTGQETTSKSLSHLKAILVLGLPSLFIGILFQQLSNWTFGLLSTLLSIGLLLYCFGRGSYRQPLSLYEESWQREDWQGAFFIARDLLHVSDDMSQCEVIQNPASLHDKVRSAFFYMLFDRVFVVVFWFMILGPAGALLARLACLYRCQARQTSQAESARWCHEMIEWIPVRLLAFTFALTGNFTACFSQWRQALVDFTLGSQRTLTQAGLAALSISCQEDNASHLVASGQAIVQLRAIEGILKRSLYTWMFVLALMTLLGFAA